MKSDNQYLENLLTQWQKERKTSPSYVSMARTVAKYMLSQQVYPPVEMATLLKSSPEYAIKVVPGYSERSREGNLQPACIGQNGFWTWLWSRQAQTIPTPIQIPKLIPTDKEKLETFLRLWVEEMHITNTEYISYVRTLIEHLGTYNVPRNTASAALHTVPRGNATRSGFSSACIGTRGFWTWMETKKEVPKAEPATTQPPATIPRTAIWIGREVYGLESTLNLIALMLLWQKAWQPNKAYLPPVRKIAKYLGKLNVTKEEIRKAISDQIPNCSPKYRQDMQTACYGVKGFWTWLYRDRTKDPLEVLKDHRKTLKPTSNGSLFAYGQTPKTTLDRASLTLTSMIKDYGTQETMDILALFSQKLKICKETMPPYYQSPSEAKAYPIGIRVKTNYAILEGKWIEGSGQLCHTTDLTDTQLHTVCPLTTGIQWCVDHGFPINGLEAK